MSPADYAAKMGRRRAALLPELRAAEKASGDNAQKMAVLLSQGPLTAADLRRLGHPYARRAPTAGQPYVINKASGVYARSWHAAPPVKIADGLMTRVYNDSKVAQFLVSGTKLMISRDQRPMIVSATRVLRKKRVQGAVSKVLRM